MDGLKFCTNYEVALNAVLNGEFSGTLFSAVVRFMLVTWNFIIQALSVAVTPVRVTIGLQ